MMNLTKEQKVYYILRLAVAMCFIGHGAFGIVGKPIWCNYFGVFGIGKEMAFALMPWLGSTDIMLGILMLVFPMRIIPLWLVLWGIATALLRPLSGEHFAEFVERAGNFGAPFVFLLITSSLPFQRNLLLKPAKSPNTLSDKQLSAVYLYLSLFAFLILMGHGWLNLSGKKSLLDQYASLGFHETARLSFTIGVFEMLMAALIFIRPSKSLLMFLVFWKVASELFYPHHELLEWVERGGSYAVLLSLYISFDKMKMRESIPTLWLKQKFSKSEKVNHATDQIVEFKTE
jgi:hypothetical protein